MKIFSNYIVTKPYVGSVQRLGYMVCTPADKPNPSFACASLAVDWGIYASANPPPANAAVGVNLNLVGRGSSAQPIKRIEAVYIDNSFNALPVYVVFPDTGFSAIALAYAVVMIPVLTQGNMANIYCEGFDGIAAPLTRVIFMEKHVDVFNIVPPTATAVVPVSVRSSAHGNNGAAQTVTTTVTMTAGIVAGDELVIYFGVENNATVTTPAGWTLATPVQSSFDTFDIFRLYIFTRTATGTEGASITVTHLNAFASYGSICIKTVTSGPELTTIATGNSITSIVPPILTPSWGVADVLGLTVCVDIRNAFLTTPSGYTVEISENGAGATPVKLRVCSLFANSATVAPGAFTIAASSGLLAETLAYR